MKLLDEGPVAARQVKAHAVEAGLSWASIRRAKGRVGIKAQKLGIGGRLEPEPSARRPKMLTDCRRCSP